MTLPLLSPLVACLAILGLWFLIGVLGLLRPASLALVGRTLFPVGAVCGAALALVAGLSLGSAPERTVLPIGLPDLPMHLRLDALTGFFLVLLGTASAGISTFAAGYFRRGTGTPPGLLCLQYHLFLASIGFLLLADDAYSFMVAWETMALSSYFLVTAQHGIAEIRRAGFVYLLMAHLGAIAILLAFGVMQGGSWQFTFDAMRGAALAPQQAALAFLLALLGFGTKAGLVPMHVWLPEAHPAAPSPVSALMSGVMLKTAVYGMLRVSFDLLDESQWWWGLAPLALGLLSAFYGVVFAAVQTEMKRLLAYSSIENIGVIFTGLGLAIVFHGVGMPSLEALALIALLYHSLNHALIKSLLFLGTGAVLHSTGERNLGRLGGLIHRMPWVAWLTLVGALSMAGLPPLNGFVSEWLLLQAFLFAHEVPRAFIDMLLPMGAGLVALAAALSAYVMVKFFGVIFLGQPREPALARAHDAGVLERIGLCWLAAGCLVLGLLPAQVIGALRIVAAELSGATLPHTDAPWWLLVPVPDRQTSYSAIVLFVAILLVVVIAVIGVRLFYHGRVRRAPAWDCGFARLDARMQDSAEGFGQPIRHIFQPFFAIERELPAPSDLKPRYRVAVGDQIWRTLYEPLGPFVQRIADAFAWLQQGRISTYLLYGFVTLVTLLALVL